MHKEPPRTAVAEPEPAALSPLVLVWVPGVAVLQAGTVGRSPQGALLLVAAPAGAAPPLPLLQPQPQPPSRACSRASNPLMTGWPLAAPGGHLPQSWA